MTRSEVLHLIRSKREAAGLTLKEAAEAAGISQPAFYNGERGKRTVKPETVVRMAAAVGLRIVHRPETFSRSREA